MKKFLLALGFAAVSMIASADYIFGWTSGEDHVAYKSDGFEYVYLTITKSGEIGLPEDGTAPYAAYNDYGWVKTDATSTSAPGDGEPAFAWLTDTYLGSDYVFNFIVKGGDFDGYVRQFSGGALSGMTVSTGSAENPSKILNIGSYGFMIPEPSSALLLLVGAALVGLKRKVA